MNTTQRGPFGVAAHSGPFAQIPALLVFDKRITPEAKMAYAALACHADHEGYCFPKQDGLGAALGINQRTLSTHIHALIKSEWISADWLVVNGHRRHCYYLHFQPTRTHGTSTGNAARTHGTSTRGTSTRGTSAKNISSREEQNNPEEGLVSLSVDLRKRTERHTTTKTASHRAEAPSYEEWLAQREWMDQRVYAQHPEWGLDRYAGWCALQGLEPRP